MRQIPENLRKEIGFREKRLIFAETTRMPARTLKRAKTKKIQRSSI